jgi:hypothetical protein
MENEKDWRLTNQEKYLKGVTLRWEKYKKYSKDWEHDHCEFCMAKFSEEENTDNLNGGYTTEDNYHWICRQCFKDFKEMFKWEIK